MPGSPYSARTTITLPGSVLRDLQQEAKREGTTVSALVRKAVLMAYPKGKQKKQGEKVCQKNQSKQK